MIAATFLSLAVAACGQPVDSASNAAAPRVSTAPFDHSHAMWTEVLAEHVQGDRFDYAALKKEPKLLEDYLAALRGVTPAELAKRTKDERYAFWINAYNAFTIKKIVDNYPLDSINDLSKAFGLKSVFDDEFIAMRAHHPDGADDDLSLNDIEHGILRPVFKDARVHAAVNCASYSCPPLLNRAFIAKDLDKTLDARMRAFLADTKRNRWNAEKERFEHSEIFDWFSEDFERDAKTVRAYLARFAPEGIAPKLAKAKLKSIDYDWSLNDVERE